MQQEIQFNYARQAPKLVPHSWPHPGLTPVESAQAGMAMSDEFADVIAATFLSQGASVLTTQQVARLIPQDWCDLLGPYTHAILSSQQAERRGIECKYVSHDGGEFHFEYRVKS
ncbi:hypothetical protein [Burkholderia aenigmatica]|uniref:hypothetical protein n=1 Tax=Burkholderia aenigmatica TaxID=2015348 RepID=UPI00264E354E|nr:hypothetical protein [Burkholderia aenigmatica]MDN7880084.1 hypothetical protein [Burkholderia aenigmatica]